MRLGCFDLDYRLRDVFTLAEVRSNQAYFFDRLSIRNVRGSIDSWLSLRIELSQGSVILPRRPIRHIDPLDPQSADKKTQEICQEHLPASFSPGHYTASLIIPHDGAGASAPSFPYEFTVLPDNCVPTDYPRAHLLASYVHEHDRLRAFANDAIRFRLTGPDPLTEEDKLHCLYDALLQKNLSYYLVSTREYADCQRIAPPSAVLRNGGSCIEVSLLIASLLWMIDARPVLLLFPDHMAVGCIPAGVSLPACVTNKSQIQTWLDQGQLHLVESTCLCAPLRQSFHEAQITIMERVTRTPCMMINVAHWRRNGINQKLWLDHSSGLVCPYCGCDRIDASDTEPPRCPACGKPIIPISPTVPAVPRDVLPQYSTCLRYEAHSSGMSVAGLSNFAEHSIWIPPECPGGTVTRISKNAFQNRKIESVVFPDTVLTIDDCAFKGCTALQQISLPLSLSCIGSAAFSGSGLTAVEIPPGVSAIPPSAFYGCKQLIHVHIGSGVEHIGSKAFAGCSNLQSVDIPASVKTIAKDAFPSGCMCRFAAQTTRIL